MLNPNHWSIFIIIPYVIQRLTLYYFPYSIINIICEVNLVDLNRQISYYYRPEISERGIHFKMRVGFEAMYFFF